MARPKPAPTPGSPPAPGPAAAPLIRLRGVRQNNLKGFDLDLPLNQLIVVTGPSGSGKSSLAFQTLYAEGQRRYVETFSPYVRQFFDRMAKPKVDRIDGIPPAIAVEQINNVRTSRSTVGTITEINDYLKVLFARVARGYCPQTGLEVQPDTTASVLHFARENLAGKPVLVLFPVAAPRGAAPADFLAFLQQQGFLRIRVYGRTYRTDEPAAYDRKVLPAMVPVVQDRLTLGPASSPRLAEAVEAAFHHGKGEATLSWEEDGAWRDKTFTKDWLCPESGIRLRPPTPGLFSFNSPVGACPQCRGFGKTIALDLDRALPDKSLSLRQGVVKAFHGSTFEQCQRDLLRCAKRQGVDPDTPFEDLDPADQEWVLDGDAGYANADEAWDAGAWYGVKGFFSWLEMKTYKMHVRVILSRYRAYTTCPSCHGGRLQPEALHFRIGGKNLADIRALPVADLHRWLAAALPADATARDGGPLDPATLTVRQEILSRLRYLVEVGLGYLTLDRETRTLSGGETARVNLTTCLGTALTSTLFVLDEPSVGLHPRDIHRLLAIMRALRDRGNTLVVVEHEEAIIRAADHLADIGPGRGHTGGDLLFTGALDRFLAPAPKRSRLPHAASLTRAYLTGERSIPVPARRRAARGWIDVRGAAEHNLRRIDVRIPLGVFCCVSGVSGSGKSTLVHRVLYGNLARQLGQTGGDHEPGCCRSVDHHQRLAHVVLVDQSPLSRTPRSTPAVYTGVFDHIRKWLAESESGRAAGVTPGFFSFNSGGGRCERCGGMGWEKVEMQFLSDLFVVCPECDGLRYGKAALEIQAEGRNIAAILEMTSSEALAFFRGLAARPIAPIVRALGVLEEVGLGYLKLGQPLNTLSGGEAQRLKLAAHLLEISPEQAAGTLLVFDEPTTGLHFDDISLLLQAFQRLVDQGYSLVVIEHNLEVVKCADHVIDLGPEAGAAGGLVVATGTPEEVARCADSHTGRFLRPVLGIRSGSRAPDALPMAAESPGPYRSRTAPPGGNGAIAIQGAREHNLRNISLEIPREQFVVVTGLSGSGKSSLAFDIIFAEGQRRFLDSMSPYARQFAEQMEKPDVDHISGLPPTVAIEQRISRGGGKSTVGTVTEVYQFLRLLFAKVGVQHCPESGEPVVAQTSAAIVAAIVARLRQEKITVLAPLVRNRKGFHTEVAGWAGRHGFTKLLVDRRLIGVEAFRPLARFKPHDIDVVTGELVRAARPELAAVRTAVEAALEHGKGTLRVLGGDGRFQVLSTRRVSAATGRSFDELEPDTFSFNSPRGWCPACRGYGLVARQPRVLDTTRAESVLEAELQEERRMEEPGDESFEPCPVCGGARLHDAARAVRVLGHRIEEIVRRPVDDARLLVESFRFTGREALIARDLLPEIAQRLRFMEQVGLGHLQLDRAATTLSGGEAQRIRLAAQLGSNLRGVLYVLDEPTIGLHPRDNIRLLDTLQALRRKGNSLLVVEHDEQTMKQADHLIDLGPGAGRFGGQVVFQGDPSLAGKPARRGGKRAPCPGASPTLDALAHPMSHPVRGTRRPLPADGAADAWLEVRGAALHNVRGVDFRIPARRLTVLTGVSGSGKSTLMRGVLLPAAQTALKARGKPPKDPRWSGLSGFDQISMVYEVDQSPIGRTSRSTPGTYVKLFDEIRRLFAQLPDARLRGFDASRFSFNTEGGRCETCEGNGRIKLEMAFLPTTWVPCEECRGQRFNPATLEVLHHGKSIGDVMAMTVAEAVEFFSSHPRIRRTLALLDDTGLGYLQLGQPSPTLSGGEAQRIKLVSQLTRGSGRSENARLKGRRESGSLYLIEEPTIGLHPHDVARLIDVLHRLVDDGHTVVVIEHNLDIIHEADCIIDIGPEAGPAGGRIVASGPPEAVARSRASRTAPFLRPAPPPGRGAGR